MRGEFVENLVIFWFLYHLVARAILDPCDIPQVNSVRICPLKSLTFQHCVLSSVKLSGNNQKQFYNIVYCISTSYGLHQNKANNILRLATIKIVYIQK